MLNRRAAIAAIGVAVLPVGSAYAQFGGLGNVLGGGGGGGGGDLSSRISSFMKSSTDVSILSGRSLAKINSAFESEDQLARRRKEQEELDKTTDPQEKQARAAKIYESESASADKLAKSADLEDKMKKLDAEKKKRVGEALFDFGIMALRAPGLVQSGQGIVQSAGANPMNIRAIVPVKDAIPVLSKIASDSGSTISVFLKVAKGADISVPQATAESKPVDTKL